MRVFILVMALLLVACRPNNLEAQIEALQVQNEELRAESSKLRAEIQTMQHRLTRLYQLERAAAVSEVCDRFNVLTRLCPEDTLQTGRWALDRGVTPSLGWYWAALTTLLLAVLLPVTATVFIGVVGWIRRLTPSLELLKARREELAELTPIWKLAGEVCNWQDEISSKADEYRQLKEAVAKMEVRASEMTAENNQLQQKQDMLRSLR
ncbi:hypothetical protein D0B54_21485 [Solimonas sp. K1W22B-7]|uniref:hypothetical protein n=1 Tax=Solimonas sp. K1W22B-7 TaxID=2303331 RepID=UPI000E331B5B|nr:hypothetical protein [Solimonas sp. K1W22B-7]AXQ31092.1 hypothetical protein D0B54_21485 [Solimonas sp. K1W22B-7]